MIALPDPDGLRWHAAPDEATGEPAAAQVWCCDLDDSTVAAACDSNWLNEAEWKRARRLRSEREQVWFLRRRSLRRGLLGRFLGVAPARLDFGEDAFGKPFLVQPDAADCRFSTSSSENAFVLAVGEAADLGADVEIIRPVRDGEAVAALELGPGRLAQLRRLAEPERSETFLRYWSLREAIGKATGVGIADAPAGGVSPEQIWELALDGAEATAALTRSGWRWAWRRQRFGTRWALVAVASCPQPRGG